MTSNRFTQDIVSPRIVIAKVDCSAGFTGDLERSFGDSHNGRADLKGSRG